MSNAIDGAYTATITVDGRQVGANAALFRNGRALRGLYAQARVPVPAGLRREAGVEVKVTFEPPVVPSDRGAWFVTTKTQEGPDDFEETGDFGPFATEAAADEWIEEIKHTLADSIFFVREARSPSSIQPAPDARFGVDDEVEAEDAPEDEDGPEDEDEAEAVAVSSAGPLTAEEVRDA
jgi:hypothetical protein